MHKHKQFFIYICGHLEVQVGDEIFTCSHFEFFLHFPHSILKIQHYPVYIYIHVHLHISRYGFQVFQQTFATNCTMSRRGLQLVFGFS